MYNKLKAIQDYLQIRNYKDFASILNTNERRIKYLFDKNSTVKKFKEEEINILVDKYFFNKKWLTDDEGEMINIVAQKNYEFIKEFEKLTDNKKEYFLYLIKAENLKED